MDTLAKHVRHAVIDTESRRLAEVVAQVDPHAPVPTCPGWELADLLYHLTEVHTFWSAVLARDPRDDAAVEAIEEDKPARPATVAELLPVREAATAALLEQLGALDDEVPRWTWWDADQIAGFTRRMQTYEARSPATSSTSHAPSGCTTASPPRA